MSLVSSLASVITAIATDIKALRNRPRSIVAAMSDETTALTTGTKTTFRMPHALTVSSVRLSVTTASTSGVVTADLKVNGTSIFTTKPSIAVNAKTATGVLIATPTVIADDSEITLSIDAAGTGATGAKASMIGTS